MKTTRKAAPKNIKKGGARKDVMASRRSCDVKGTGLSHYILMDTKKK